ncbi:MAG: CoA ester lyase [Gammaproteobacteria bacterium]|nr:CoA ester lyase [Gammaproteobacteria bacterium]
MEKVIPRRSVLYMPGANTRALEKARTLACDGIIFDLEDAVAPAGKFHARENVCQAVEEGGYGHRELVVRVNGLDSPWGSDDVRAIAPLSVDALLFPKIESFGQIENILRVVDKAGGSHVPLWLMIETPKGILDVQTVAGGSQRIQTLVMGTSDLVKELRARHTETRNNLAYALQHCVLAARSAGLDILDGVHLDFRNLNSFETVCEQGLAMGFDGKTLIHPTQIEIANRVFGVASEEIERARAVLKVWRAAQAEGKGVAELDGQLVENLHAEDAERTLKFAEALADREGPP